MASFNDLSPEEQEASHQQLIAPLQKIYRTPETEHFTPQAQTTAITRVEQRLATTDPPISQQAGTLHLNRLFYPPRSPRWRSENKATSASRQKHLLRTLAAVLVVGILIGTTAVLVALRYQEGASKPHVTISEPSGTPTTVSMKTGGLTMAFNVTAGPYFLKELLAITMTLTNPTPTTYKVYGAFRPDPCSDGALWADLDGGFPPSFSIPAETFTRSLRCPGGEVNAIDSGQTVTLRQYVPIKQTGLVTLKVSSQFAPANFSTTSPLPIHSLTLRLAVTSRVPADRILLVQQHGSEIQVTVQGPAHPQLAFLYAANCQEPDDCGNYIWQLLATNPFPLPVSSYRIGPWNYAIGAVGSGIVTGTWDSSAAYLVNDGASKELVH